MSGSERPFHPDLRRAVRFVPTFDLRPWLSPAQRAMLESDA